MKIAYYTHETITSGLFKTQVQDVLTALSKEQDNNEYTLVVYNYFWTVIKNFKLIGSLKKELSLLKIKLCVFPILLPVKYSLTYYPYFEFLKIFFRFIILITYKRKADIHHARGYLLTYGLVKNNLQSVIFDMRSLWVLENISAGNLISDSKLTNRWFELERKSILCSRFCVGVSKAMGDYVQRIHQEVDFKLIPISVNFDKFKFDEHSRKQIRVKQGWEKELVMVYSGSLGLSRINLETLQSILITLKNKLPELKGIAISEEPKQLFIDLFRRANFKENDYLISNSKEISIYKILSAADFGIHALPLQLDSETRLGTKVAEYLMNGLPIIVNENVGAAAEIVEKNKLGYVFENINDITFNNIKKTGCDWRKFSSKASVEYAKNNFASEKIVEMYNSLYMNI